MKDYSNYDCKTIKYIKKFKMTDNKIIVQTIKDGSYQLERNDKNKEYLLERMEEEATNVIHQHIELDMCQEKLEMKIYITMALTGLPFNTVSHLMSGSHFYPALTIGIVGAIGTLGTYRRIKTRIEDIAKMRYFLSNKTDFQRNISDVETITQGLSRKLSKNILNEEEEDVMDINRLNDCSYDDLILLRKNILNHDGVQHTLKYKKK